MRTIARRLASRRLTPYLFIAYGVFLVLLFVWSVKISAVGVGNISRMAPFLLTYGFAAVHLTCCLVLFWPAVRQRTSLEPLPRGLGTPVVLSEEPRATVAKAAEREGFALRWDEDERRGVLWRNRWAPLGTVLLHAALLLLPVAYGVSRATRFEGRAWILEGHRFSGTRADYTSVAPPDAFDERAPRVAFDVESVSATFWGPRLFFTDLRAVIDRGDGRHTFLTLSEPTWFGGARVTLKGYNYSPALELYGPDGSRLTAGDTNLRLFPPGTADSLDLPGLPHRATIRLYPDAPRGEVGNHSNALVAPLFHVAISRGARVVAEGWLRPGDFLAFEGYRLSFPHVRRGGEVVVHRDWGYPILWSALILAFVGAAARIAFPSSRLFVSLDEHGQAWAVARDDPFSSHPAEALVARWRPDAP